MRPPPCSTATDTLFPDTTFFRSVIAAKQGRCKAGIEFGDWGAIGERYVHPFGYHGHEIHGVAFHQLYLRARARRQMPPISDWSMSAAAIRHGRFARPGAGASFPLDQLYYA